MASVVHKHMSHLTGSEPSSPRARQTKPATRRRRPRPSTRDRGAGASRARATWDPHGRLWTRGAGCPRPGDPHFNQRVLSQPSTRLKSGIWSVFLNTRVESLCVRKPVPAAAYSDPLARSLSPRLSRGAWVPPRAVDPDTQPGKPLALFSVCPKSDLAASIIESYREVSLPKMPSVLSDSPRPPKLQPEAAGTPPCHLPRAPACAAGANLRI